MVSCFDQRVIVLVGVLQPSPIQKGISLEYVWLETFTFFLGGQHFVRVYVARKSACDSFK
jgi:hypothetical protein